MWFLSNLARLHREREAIAALVAEVDWLPVADWKLDATVRIEEDNHPDRRQLFQDDFGSRRSEISAVRLAPRRPRRTRSRRFATQNVVNRFGATRRCQWAPPSVFDFK